jgi:hypothetical protein
LQDAQAAGATYEEPPFPDDEFPLAQNASSGSRPPHDTSAEQAVLGALLLAPELAETIAPELRHSDFYQPRHGDLWDTIHDITATGRRPDPVLVLDQLQRTGQLTRLGGAPYLHGLMAACPIPGQAATYAKIVRDSARLRAISNVATGLQQLAITGNVSTVDTTLAEALQRLDDTVRRYGPAARDHLTVPNISDFLTDVDEDQHDWIIPGLLERHDRVILTGGEGSGKSTLGRQVAVQAAAGIHPFTGQPITPIRVLILDFENTEAQLKRELAKLYAKTSRRLTPGDQADRLRVQSRIAGVNLLDPEDRAWVHDVVTDSNPDLIVTGPAYKMTDGDTDKEKESKPVALYLDQLRSEFDTAIWLEAHVGNEQPGTRKRPERPFGWSGWRRWPEFGLYLSKEGDLNHWRGDRDKRHWPAALTRGKAWPWVVAESPDFIKWQQLRECMEMVGEPLSIRELADRTGLPKSTIQDIANKFHTQWVALRYKLEQGDQ